MCYTEFVSSKRILILLLGVVITEVIVFGYLLYRKYKTPQTPNQDGFKIRQEQSKSNDLQNPPVPTNQKLDHTKSVFVYHKTNQTTSVIENKWRKGVVIGDVLYFPDNGKVYSHNLLNKNTKVEYDLSAYDNLSSLDFKNGKFYVTESTFDSKLNNVRTKMAITEIDLKSGNRKPILTEKPKMYSAYNYLTTLSDGSMVFSESGGDGGSGWFSVYLGLGNKLTGIVHTPLPPMKQQLQYCGFKGDDLILSVTNEFVYFKNIITGVQTRVFDLDKSKQTILFCDEGGENILTISDSGISKFDSSIKSLKIINGSLKLANNIYWQKIFGDTLFGSDKKHIYLVNIQDGKLNKIAGDASNFDSPMFVIWDTEKYLVYYF